MGRAAAVKLDLNKLILYYDLTRPMAQVLAVRPYPRPEAVTVSRTWTQILLPQPFCSLRPSWAAPAV